MTQLLIVKCLRPDKIIYFIENIFTELISNASLTVDTIDLNGAYNASTSKIPIILFETNDTEIMNEFINFTNKIHSNR